MLGAQAARSPSTPQNAEARRPLSPTRSRSPHTPRRGARQSPSLVTPPMGNTGEYGEDSEDFRGSSSFWKLRSDVARFYNSFRFQMFVACLIGANFLTNIVEKEIDPQGIRYTREFLRLEYVYNILFTVELFINLYAHRWTDFWRSGWNVFDVIVVTIGLVNMVNLPLPECFSMLRMIRAFRVFRLFKRVRSLKKIITALAHAVPGVMNAFLLLTIVMCIYAILAVELFINVGKDCHDMDAVMPPSYRGNCFGEEYFGSFSKSLYSFFQVLTGESWSEAIARPVLWWHTNPVLSVGSAVFFVSFVLVTAFVLTNVVVAVLLDKMVDSGIAVEGEDIGQGATPTKSPSSPLEAGNHENLSGFLLAIESQIRQLTKASTEMRADLDGTKQEMREQFATVLAAVNDLGNQRRDRL